MTTVHAVGMHLIRQRGTECSQPEFIAAYLEAEVAKNPRLVTYAVLSRFARAFRRATESVTLPTTLAHRAGSERAS